MLLLAAVVFCKVGLQLGEQQRIMDYVFAFVDGWWMSG